MMMKNPVDQPFRSREEIELEAALVAQYRQIGNPDLLMPAPTVPAPAPAKKSLASKPVVTEA